MVVGSISASTVYLIVLVILVLGFGGWQLWTVVRRNQAATLIDEETFQAGMRRAQVVDLREKRDFDAGHILGARSIPYATFRTYYQQLRPDIPVYLYDQGRTLSTRAAILLGKHDFKEVYILKTGYSRWEGKTKQTT